MPNQALLEQAFSDQMAALHDSLAPYQGGKARIVSYSLGHSELRIEVSNDEDSCIILCESSYAIQGPFWWQECAIAIRPQFYKEKHIQFVVRDARVGFELRCGRATVLFPDHPSAQSREMAVFRLLPLALNDIRAPLATARLYLDVLERLAAHPSDQMSEEDRAECLAMAVQQLTRLRTVVDQLGRYARYDTYLDDQTPSTEQHQPMPDVPEHIASIISHELKTPLYSARGFLQLLHHRLDRIPVDLRDEFIADALHAVERAWTVTNDICRIGYRQAGVGLVE